MVWWIELDEIFGFITYTEKLDRFTKMVDNHYSGCNSDPHDSKIFEAKINLISSLYSVFDAESEKSSFKTKKKK